MTAMDGIYVSLTHEPLNPMEIMDLVRSPEAGAIVFFAGTTRNNFDGTLTRGLFMIRQASHSFRLRSLSRYGPPLSFKNILRG
jgi:molybdopterin synthase catalytic subunit